jgi:flavin-dependent dehydrogenase
VVEPPVALEANFPYANERESRAWSDVLALELGSMPGGYGWSFPKEDHFNVGCGGWHSAGGALRDHLAALRHHYGLDTNAMVNLRGHHLPTRTDGAPITTGRVVLVGDAAGLVDPISGEGIYPAFVSGRLAAEAIGRFLGSKDPDLYPYEAAVERELMDEMRAATMLRDAYHYTPRPCWFVLKHSSAFRRALCQFVTGERTYQGFLKTLGPLAILVSFWAARGRAARGATA